MDEEKKLLISVGLILFGWFLGQGTELFRKWSMNRRLKVALYEELQDLASILNALRIYFLHRLEGHSVGFLETSEPLPLNNQIYTNKYTDISLKLNRNQRLSYETIHGFINAFNKRLDPIAHLTIRAIETHDSEIFDKLGDMLKAQYLNIEMLRSRIGYHLRNPRRPAFGTNDEGVSEILKAQKICIEQIESLIEKWQSGTLEDYLAQKEFRYQILTMPSSEDK